MSGYGKNSHVILPQYAVAAIPQATREQYVEVFGRVFLEKPQLYAKELLADQNFYTAAIRIGHGYCGLVRDNLARNNYLSKLDVVRLGSGYGGWSFVASSINPSSIIYSFGVGVDTTFDEEIISNYGCTVYGFDPTPQAVRHGQTVQARDPRFKLVTTGVWDKDMKTQFFAPTAGLGSMSIDNIHGQENFIECDVKRVSTFMKELGNKKVDIIKLDVEGAAYAVVDDVLKAGLDIDQILFECDMPTPPWTIQATLENLFRHGYSLFYVEGLNFGFVRNSAIASV